MVDLDTLHEQFKVKLKAGPADHALRQQVLQAVEALAPDSEESAATVNWKHVKCCTMLSEIADHLGLHAVAVRCVTHAERWFNQAPADFATLHDDAVLFTRESLRAYAVHAFVVVYRGGDRASAIKRINRCLALMEWFDDKKAHPMFGTRAQAHRYLAEIYRTARQYGEARASLLQAFRFVQERFDHHSPDDVERSFAQHRFALCFLSRARIDYLEGALSHADEALVAVKALLVRWVDPITSATADLMQGIIARNRVSGDTGDMLERARTLITRALHTFEREGHVAKTMWARFELAVLLMHAHRATEAREEFERLDADVLPYFDTPGWLMLRARRIACYSYCRRSTLEGEVCHNRSQAMQWAERALELATDKAFPLGRGHIDALITRASVHLLDPSGSSVIQAERDLQAAATLNSPPRGSDTRFATIIHARLAQCRLRRDDLSGAEAAWTEASRRAGSTEHASVLALLDEVQQEIAIVRNDAIFRLDEGVTYEDAVQRLQRFLVRRARQRHTSIADAAAQLDIAESTFYKWDKDEKTLPAKPRRSHRGMGV